MNDFTKEELQILLLDMQTYANHEILKESPIYESLRLKLERLIDDYCEHEFIVTIDYRDWHKKEAAAIPICRKCNCNPKTTQ